MINLVELCEEPKHSPCKHGNLVEGHAVYCHSDHPDAPRKCSVFRHYGLWKDHWNKAECKLFDAWNEGE